MTKPLSNIKVVDLTQALAGPFCTQLLATMGAEVFRVELPGGGYGANLFRAHPLDMLRRLWGNTQHNKKNITLNLRIGRGKEIFLELVKKADVVVENFGPGVMEKLGLSYDIMKETNPRIIYCDISGYGQNGPWKDKIAYDPCIQAASGLMSTTGYPDGQPVKVGASISDCLGGLYAAIGILIALHARDTITGRGQMIDCAMYDATISVVTESALGKMPRMGNRHPFAVPMGIYGTKDGKMEFISVQRDAQWETFMKLIGRQDLVEKNLPLAQRLELADEIDNLTEEWANNRTQQEIEDTLNGLRIPCAPVLETDEVQQHPQSAAREMFIEVEDMYGKISGVIGVVPKLSDTPGSIEWGVMPSGSNNEEVYAGLLGFSEEELDRLRSEGVI